MRNGIVFAPLALMVCLLAPACQPGGKTKSPPASQTSPESTPQAQAEPEKAKSFFDRFRKRSPRGANGSGATATAGAATAPPTLQAIDLSDAVRPIPQDGPVQLSAARNEWISFVLEVGPRPAGTPAVLRLRELKHSSGGATIAPSQFEVYQALSMPVDVNR